MFCTSLRRRKEWAAVVPHLLQNKDPKFRESKLDTHDVNLPLPSPGAPGTRYLRFVLLSSADEDSAARNGRIERLGHLGGENDAALVYLLDHGGDQSSFLRFQLELADTSTLPLIPLQCPEHLPSTLQAFWRSFLQASTLTRPSLAHNRERGATQALLPYSGLSPPLREHIVHLLSDLSFSFADLANKCSAESGRRELVDYLGEQDAQRVILFWSQEYLL